MGTAHSLIQMVMVATIMVSITVGKRVATVHEQCTTSLRW